MKTQPPDLGNHNAVQREYFKGADKRTMLPDDTPYNRRQAAELADFAELRPGERVLEVGCGMGRHAFLLARQGIIIEGLDLSPDLIGRLRAFDGGRYNIRTHVGDVLDYASQFSGLFDAVIGFFMLHHLSQGLAAYFTAMSGMLKPGGRVAFVEPNPANPLYYAQIFCTPGMSWRAEKGMRQMRERTLFAAMTQAGLDDLAIKRYGFFPRFVSNHTWGAQLERALEGVQFWQGMLPFQMIRGRRR